PRSTLSLPGHAPVRLHAYRSASGGLEEGQGMPLARGLHDQLRTHRHGAAHDRLCSPLPSKAPDPVDRAASSEDGHSRHNTDRFQAPVEARTYGIASNRLLPAPPRWREIPVVLRRSYRICWSRIPAGTRLPPWALSLEPAP